MPLKYLRSKVGHSRSSFNLNNPPLPHALTLKTHYNDIFILSVPSLILPHWIHKKHRVRPRDDQNRSDFSVPVQSNLAHPWPNPIKKLKKIKSPHSCHILARVPTTPLPFFMPSGNSEIPTIFNSFQVTITTSPSLSLPPKSNLFRGFLLALYLFDEMSLRKTFSKKGFSARSSFSCSPKRSSALLENLLQQKSSELRRRGDEEEEEDGRDQLLEGGWSNMLPELLGDIIERVESSEERWPLRKDVVACACVCKRWRDVTRAVVKPPQQSGKITFPSSLKQVC